MEQEAPTLSHVSCNPNRCLNIKSVRNPKLRCKNPASHGAYCGLHYKTPRPWVSTSPKTKQLQKKSEHALRILAWWRKRRGLYLFSTRGPAYYARTIPVNDTDFFSTDKISDISGAYFFSYKDEDSHVYAFDIRSLHSLVENARHENHQAENPYTRAVLSDVVKKKLTFVVNILKAHGCSPTWAPLHPATPEQQFRMKVVDVFHTIDELNYYSSPDWFLNMDVRAHRRFYSELHDIWVHRAQLSIQQKNLIVPQHMQRLFRHAPWTTRDIPIEGLQKMNLSTIRMLISSAEDRNDRILGAMYVVTALTIVSPVAREAYPWLFESVDVGPIPVGFVNNNWIHALLADLIPPPLQLPPPAANQPD